MSFGKRGPRNPSSPGPFKRSNTSDSDSLLPHRVGNNNTGDDMPSSKIKIVEQLTKKYEYLQDKFRQNGLTQQNYYFLKTIAQDSKSPQGISGRMLFSTLVEIAKQLLMNQLEIAVWSIYLEKFVWPHATLEKLQDQLLYSAFASKTYMNDDTSIFQ